MGVMTCGPGLLDSSDILSLTNILSPSLSLYSLDSLREHIYDRDGCMDLLLFLDDALCVCVCVSVCMCVCMKVCVCESVCV